MKKFKYNLETVLNYKDQVLDRIKGEYAERMALVNAQKARIEILKANKIQAEDDFEVVKHQGASIEKFLEFTSMIDRYDKMIESENMKLLNLQKAADEKKAEVIAANIDVNKFEKLKEKKFDAYRKEVSKDNEAFIEEFVSHQAALTAQNL